jgi:hypothetical protein
MSVGLVFAANAQSPDFSLNGLGRSIISNNSLSGNLVDANEGAQTKDVSGYNLFDLQSNLDLDSTFNAKAIFRTKSPFGTSFGSLTNFEFRQFSMGGNVNGFKYNIGDIRVEISPFTVFNSNLVGTGFESHLFSQRRDIIEYENFNDGNTWLLQGTSGQYGWNIGENSGLGIYAFTTRTNSSNELNNSDRLLSGGRLEFQYNQDLKFGFNEVSLYDLVTKTADFDYNNNVITADLVYNIDLSDAKITFGAEGGGSFYNFRDNLSETDTSYKDFVISSDVEYLLKDKGLKFGLDVKRVGALFSSPTAQSRRYNPLTAPGLFSEVKSAQSYYDRFTDEAVYNNSINVNLMPYFNIFNNLSPYGDATPNRFVVGATFTTDTSITSLESSVRFDYGTEVVGEGGEAKRTFLVLTGGGIAHLGTYLNMNRLFDVNAGIRYESTSRNEGAKIALNSLLLDLGASVEAVKKMDLLVGVKYFSAKGNEFTTVRDGFNLVTNFNEVNYDVSELVLSGGARIRFSEKQSFTINYNLVNFSDERTESAAYNLGQLFLNYTGKF